jgi:hypothetical protein
MGTMRCAVVLFCVSLVTGCTAEVVEQPGPPPSGPASDGRFTLKGNLERTEGLVLESGTVVEVEGGIDGGDFWLQIGKEVSLRGAGQGGDAFCGMGTGFASVTEIPVSSSACLWEPVRLGANAAGTRYPGDDAFLVRDLGLRLYRLLLIEHGVGLVGPGISSVTFDVAAVPE